VADNGAGTAPEGAGKVAVAKTADGQKVAEGAGNPDAGSFREAEAGNAETLSQANAYTDARFEEALKAPMAAIDDLRTEVSDRFRDTDSRIEKMGAMNAAMLNMATSAAGIRTPNRMAVGIGVSGGEQALSLGYQRAFSDRLTMTVGGAFSDDESSAGVGVGFGW